MIKVVAFILTLLSLSAATVAVQPPPAQVQPVPAPAPAASAAAADDDDDDNNKFRFGGDLRGVTPPKVDMPDFEDGVDGMGEDELRGGGGEEEGGRVEEMGEGEGGSAPAATVVAQAQGPLRVHHIVGDFQRHSLPIPPAPDGLGPRRLRPIAYVPRATAQPWALFYGAGPPSDITEPRAKRWRREEEVALLNETAAGETLAPEDWCDRCKRRGPVDGRVCVVWTEEEASKWASASIHACAPCKRQSKDCTWGKKKHRPSKKRLDSEEEVERRLTSRESGDQREAAGLFKYGRIRGG